MYKRYNITVSDETEIVRIDTFLSTSYPELSRTQLKNIISDGRVFANEKVVKPSTKVHPGDEIFFSIAAPVESAIHPEDIPLEIIYQDSEFAVINKPAGLIVHPTGDQWTGTLVNALLFHLKDLSGINGVIRPGVVHRLDKDTSGIILIAKNDVSHRFIADQFRDRTIQKTYFTILWGKFLESTGEIDKAISRSVAIPTKMICGEGGKESFTSYEVIDEFDYLSYVKVSPKTGRTHQIRTHFHSIGHPVFGDKLYTGRTARINDLPGKHRVTSRKLLDQMPRQALHAGKISLISPLTKERVEFELPIPEDMQNILNILQSRVLEDDQE